jgi:hypothetical protein
LRAQRSVAKQSQDLAIASFRFATFAMTGYGSFISCNTLTLCILRIYAITMTANIFVRLLTNFFVAVTAVITAVMVTAFLLPVVFIVFVALLLTIAVVLSLLVVVGIVAVFSLLIIAVVVVLSLLIVAVVQ